MPSECGLTPAFLAGIGDARIRQRMEACQQGILQLDTLRQKHHKLMEQLKAQYPDFASPSHRPITNNDISSSINYESPTVSSLQNPQNSLNRCESPLSACMSHRSSVSIDSGYTSISSDPLLNFCSSPMSYSAYRKKASTLDRKTIESTTGLRTNRYTRIQKTDDSWQRPRSMYAVLPDSQNENLEEKTSSNLDKKDEEALAGVSVAATARKLLDASTFSQITPPPASRKFATLGKPNTPKPLPRSTYSSSTTPARTLSASSSALYQPPPPVPPARSMSRPPPQFAKYETSVPLQNAKVYAPPRSLPPLPTSPNSAFTPKKQTTPPSKHRNVGISQRTFIVPIIPPSENFSSRHRVPEGNIHLAQPAAVLSRQQSSDSSSASPMEVRKLLFSTPHTISRYGSSDTKKTGFDKSPRRREKIWHESEGL